MRTRHPYILFLLLILISSCKKDEASISNQYFIKVLNTETDYFSQNIFQTPNGDIVVCSFSNEDVTNESEYGQYNSLISKYSSTGDFIWTKELPQSVHDLRKGILLQNGNMAFTGMDNSIGSQEVGIVITNSEGQVINDYSFFNQTTSSTLLTSNTTIDCVQLRNGNIAFILPELASASVPSANRLIIFDQSLNLLLDRTYLPDDIIPNTNNYQMSIIEDEVGNIFINGRIRGNSLDPILNAVFCLKLQTNSYDPIYFQEFFASELRSTSGICLSSENQPVWSSSGSTNSDLIFNLRNQNTYFVGRNLSLWKSDGDSSNTIHKDITGFSRNAYIQTTKLTNDGGYISVGTCNINPNSNLSSDYKILLVKCDQNLNQQWLQVIDSSSPSLGFDVVETSTGYLICGAHYSIDALTKPLIINTDKNGTIF